MTRFFETRERVIRYELLEFYHPAIGVKRYVNNQFFDKQFLLESDAPRNHSQVVTFEAISYELQKPSVSEGGVISMPIQFGRVGSDMKKYVKQIKAYNQSVINTDPAEVIFREYIGSEYNDKFDLSVSDISLSGDIVQITCSDDNPNSANVARMYLPQKFIGLKVIE